MSGSTSKLSTLFIIPEKDKRKTFDQDENLPNLPVPDLNDTLNVYLESLKPFVTSEEYDRAKELTGAFSNGIGRVLHEKLVEKARKERNWVEKWWEDVAYLQIRLPLLLSCNMIGVLPKNAVPWSHGTEDDQIQHAAAFGHHLVRFWQVLRTEKLLPTQTADKKTYLSMSQYKRLFNTARTPGDVKDSLVSYFKTCREGDCPSNAIIICKGRIFSLETIDERGNIQPPAAWEKSLRKIVNLCEKEPISTCPIGMLTCDNRSYWSENRRRLSGISQKNSAALKTIDQSLFVMVLDDDSPETDSDVATRNICGNYSNRWTDKSMTLIFYKNGRSGSLCDHTAFDGIVAIACLHYVVTALQESSMNDRPKKDVIEGGNDLSEASFEELIFDVDELLLAESSRLEVETMKYKNSVSVTKHLFDDYGKLEIQFMKFHPDSFVQMCLQLAYVTLHGKPAPCYETATTRKFYNGRTETVRSATTECLEWVGAMLDNKCNNEERKKLLEKAVKRHDELMSEARENRGCDRHLFGLYCIAVEEGIEIPEIFTDHSYFKSGGGGNYVLSTSCTGYTPLGGGVAPMCENGYGVFYNILPYSIQFTLSVYNTSNETNALRYFECLKSSFRRARETLMSASRMNVSKL